jgi:hypothetical protein
MDQKFVDVAVMKLILCRHCMQLDVLTVIHKSKAPRAESSYL